MSVLAMFPLGSVLLPGQVLPLHVFEPRYRQLVEDCLTNDPPEFGVVLIERGSEVGGGEARTLLGTLARIVEVARTDDGRYAVLAVGVERIRVLAWLPDNPYPLADVERWPDEDPDPPGLAERVATTHRDVRRLLAMAVELGDLSADPNVAVSDDALVATYHLCGLAPVGPADRQSLLGCAGPTERLDLLDELLADLGPVLDFRMADTRPDDA